MAKGNRKIAPKGNGTITDHERAKNHSIDARKRKIDFRGGNYLCYGVAVAILYFLNSPHELRYCYALKGNLLSL